MLYADPHRFVRGVANLCTSKGWPSRAAVPLIFAITTIFASAIAGGAVAEELASYRSEQKVAGEIRIWGVPADGKLLSAWEAAFSALNPGVTFSNKLTGPESAMAGVYNDVADLALMGREMRLPVDSMAFEWVHRYKVTSIEVANGGLVSERPNTTLAVFVHKDNPLSRMSLVQLDAVLGGEHKRGRANARNWGDLGLTGAWTQRPISIYGPQLDSAPALFVRRVVMKDSRKWNPAIREVAGVGADILAALAKDPNGIAVTFASASHDNVKALPLATEAAGPYLMPTAETIAARTYPLARVVTMVLNRVPGQPIDPKVREFLAFILGREGQALIAGDGVHVPLNAATAQEQLKHLQ